MLDQGLYAMLVASTPVTAIVGSASTRSDKSTGIFGGEAPEQAALPLIVVEQISAEPIMTFDGPSLSRYAGFRITSRAKSRLEAKQLMRAVRQVLENYTGTLADGTQVQNVETRLEGDTFEFAPFEYAAPLEVEIFYTDSGT